MTLQREQEPTSVTEGSKQVGEAWNRWNWVERAVWTERMLETLETGVRGGKWFSLIDKVHSRANLVSAYRKVAANKGSAGVDHVSVKRFGAALEEEVKRLAQELESGTYRPRAVKRVYIPKPGTNEHRPLGIPTVRDRVVQAALRQVIEPIFERDFAPNSFGFRPKRGCNDALREVVKRLNEGSRWVVDADFRQYFDTICHEKLMCRVSDKISDSRVLDLIESFLKQPIFENLKQWTPEGGTPQGGVISPLLANVFLDPLDHLMEQWGFQMIRYADDAVIMCKSQREAEQALNRLASWSQDQGLTLHPTKTKIVHMDVPGGFDFLGYHFEVSKRKPTKINRWPRKKSMKKLRCRIKPLTKRCNGHSLDTIIKQINPILNGWFNYFMHSKSNTFEEVDGWVRGRLRSLLRKRRKYKGRARGADHQRWSNAFFHSHGLFSATRAHRLNFKSSVR